jgi:hypothetical protein
VVVIVLLPVFRTRAAGTSRLLVKRIGSAAYVVDK